MEQARYWMCAKRKHDMTLSSSNNNSYGDSWEEQAFAEDAASGALGGCIWPPRSYTCSFCRREFRSAQALGGHMNVHRRDRARMKQLSPPTSNNIIPNLDPHPHKNNNNINRVHQYPNPQICSTTFLNNPNSKSHHDHGVDLLIRSSPNSNPLPIRVSSQKTFSTTNSSSPPSIWSNLVAHGKYSCFSNNLKGEEKEKLKSTDLKKDERNLEVMIDSSTFRAKQDHVAEPTNNNCKRRRVDEENIIPFANLFPKASSIQRCHPQSEVLERIPSAIEELDLELRLGETPKVK